MRALTAVTAVLAATLWLLPQPLPAQHHGQRGGEKEVEKEKHESSMGHGMMSRHMMGQGGMQGHMMDRGMRGGMMSRPPGPGPMMLLHQKDALALTESQVQELESLREEMRSAHQAAREEMRPLHEELQEVVHAREPDLDRYQQLLQQMADHHVQVRVQAARVHQRATDVLTDEQQSQVRYGMKLMRQMMRRHMEERGMMREREEEWEGRRHRHGGGR